MGLRKAVAEEVELPFELGRVQGSSGQQLGIIRQRERTQTALEDLDFASIAKLLDARIDLFFETGPFPFGIAARAVIDDSRDEGLCAPSAAKNSRIVCVRGVK